MNNMGRSKQIEVSLSIQEKQKLEEEIFVKACNIQKCFLSYDLDISKPTLKLNFKGSSEPLLAPINDFKNILDSKTKKRFLLNFF